MPKTEERSWTFCLVSISHGASCVKDMATLSSNTLNILNFRRLQQFTWGVCKTKPRLIMQSLHQDGHKVIF